MKKLKQIIVSGACLLAGTLAMVSCTDGNDWETDSAYERLFSTQENSFSITPAGRAAQAEASWKATPNTTSYIIEVSTNPLTDQVEMGAEGSIVFGDGVEKITETTYLMENLEPETTYYARIKSVNKGGMESHWVYYDQGGTFKTRKEEVLNGASEVTESSIRVTWESGCTVTSLRVYNEAKGYDQTILLENEALQACAVTVRGLSPLTTYTFEIYNGERLRGTIDVTTEAGALAQMDVTEIGKTGATLSWDRTDADGYAVTADGTVPTAPAVTLENVQTCTLSGLESYTTYTFYLFSRGSIVGTAIFTTQRDYPAGYDQVSISSVADWEAALAATYTRPDVVFILREGLSLDLSASSVKLTGANGLQNLVVWGEGTDKPELNMTLTIEGSLSSVEFYNLSMRSTQKGEWGKTYLINYQEDDAVLGELKIENCEVGETGMAIRAKMATGTLGNITINNSVFADCHEAVIGINEVAEAVNAGGVISLTNSSFLNPGNYLVRTRYHQYDFRIARCSFYGAPARGTMIDDYKMSSTISLSSCLFGGTASGVKLYSDGAVATAEHLYSASDFQLSKKSYNVSDTGIASETLFPNAAQGDLTVGAAAYKEYGDPRWN